MTTTSFPAPFELVGQEDRARLPLDLVDAYPVSMLQQGMILHSSMRPGSATYHDISLYEVQAPLDVGALRLAAADIVARHPILRTGFDIGSYGCPLQLVHRLAAARVSEFDHTGLDAAEHRSARLAWLAEQQATPFDLEVPPLLRLAAFDRGDGFVLGVSVHHAILDGMSLVRVLRDLLTAYRLRMYGHTVDWPAPAGPPYSAFVRLERLAIDSEEQRAWWRRRFSGFTPVRFPRSEASSAGGTGGLHRRLDPAVTDRLRNIGRVEGIGVKHFGLAVHQWVLGQVTGRTEVASGLVVGVRPELAGAVEQAGLFLNTVPCRMSLAHATWLDLARRAGAAEAELLPYRRVPYAVVRGLLGREDPCDTTFIYTRFQDYRRLAEDTGIVLSALEFHEETNFPFSVYLMDDPGSGALELRLQYRRDSVDDETAAELAQRYVDAFARCTANPTALAPAPAAVLGDHWREPGRHVRPLEVFGWHTGSAEVHEERATIAAGDLAELRAACGDVGLPGVLLAAYAIAVGECFSATSDFLLHQVLPGHGTGNHIVPVVVPWRDRHQPEFTRNLPARLRNQHQASGGTAAVPVARQLPPEQCRFVYHCYPTGPRTGPAGPVRGPVAESHPADEARLIVDDLGDELMVVLRHHQLPPLDLPRRVLAIARQLATAPPPRHKVDLLTEGERTRLLDTWHTTTATTRDTLTDLVVRQAARTPHAIAVRAPDRDLTYAQLLHHGQALAATLTSAAGEAPVGVLAPRGPHLVTALLAALLAGRPYVPLDPELPPRRLHRMIADAGVTTLLTHGEHAEITDGFAGDLVPVPDPAPTSTTGNPVEVTICPGDLAYVIFTSGSTGTPKGAENQHDGVVNRLSWMQSEFGLTADDVVLQKTPMSFDVSVWEFFWPLLSGARMVLAAPGGHRDPLYLVDLMARERITTVHFVPSMLRFFLDAVTPGALPHLRRILCSGEALPGDLRDRCRELLPHVALSNLYGPTEAAVDVTVWHCRPDETGPAVPIGRPISNVRTYVLDEELRLLPPGAAGELYLGGVQVGRGYRGRPGLTADRFVPDPFVSGRRMYRTGDRARRRPDGALEFLGRLDHQVKVRGFRIELPEIESVLRARPGVLDAAVDVRDIVPGHPQLIAYLVADRGVTDEAIRSGLAEILPDYMVPGHYVRLARLPVTPNGKLDRTALPTPVGRKARSNRAAFGTDAERRIAGLWSEVLGHADFTSDTNFFDAGGDSLLLLRTHARLRQELPTAAELSPIDLFHHPTIGTLADLLAGAAGTTSTRTAADERAGLRLRSAQRRTARGVR
ncbi:amino acid adenylation domain-containing protein [Amycolatopsis sp. NPDC005003]